MLRTDYRDSATNESHVLSRCAAFFCRCSKFAVFFWAEGRAFSDINYHNVPSVSILGIAAFSLVGETCQTSSIEFPPFESTDTLLIH